MLNTEWPINNIFKKIRSKTNNTNRNIFYHTHNSLFDTIFNSLESDFLVVNNTSKNAFEYNFDAIVYNNVLISSKEIEQAYNSYADIIIFNHDDLTSLKREDVYILNRNIKQAKIKVINFHPESNNIINNSYNINYPLKTDIVNNEKTKDILIINLNDNHIVNSIYNNLKQLNHDVDIIKSFEKDINSIYLCLSQYKVVIEMSSRINILCSLICGCNVISQLNLKDCPENNFVIKSNNAQSIYNNLKQYLTRKSPDTSILKKTYDEKIFLNQLKEIFYATN